MPNNWKKYKLGELITHKKGFAFKSSWFESKGVPVVRISDTTETSINIDSCHRISIEKANDLKDYRLYNNDVIIATVGSWPPNYSSVVGKVIRVPIDANEALLNQNAVKLIAKENIDNSYLYYQLKSNSFLKYIVNTAQGSANQASIKLTDIFDYKIILPPLNEQKDISEILSSLDDKIELNLQTNKTLEEMANALYKHWFVDFGPFQNDKFIESELGLIPEGWEVKNLKSFGEIVCGKTPSKNESENFGNEYPFIKIPDMHNSVFIYQTQDGLSEKGHNTQSKKLIPAHSIIVSCIATVGVVSLNILPSHTNQQINSIVPYDKTDYAYLYFACKNLKDDFLNLASGGSATLNMNTSTFSNIEIIKAPTKVRIKYYELVSNLFEQIKNNILESNSLKETRDYLLPKLISGEIRVKDAAKKLKEIL